MGRGARLRVSYPRRLGARALLVVSAVTLTAAAAPLSASTGGGAQGLTGPGWRVQPSPFRILFSDGGRVVASERARSSSVGSVGYQVVGGARHALGNLVGERRRGDSAEFTVATDEPGRTATVTIGGSAHDVEVGVAFGPGGGVKRVFESLQGPSGDHFLGGGMRHDAVDLRGRIISGKVYYPCGDSVVTPFFASSSGYGLYLSTPGVSRIAFPGTSASNGTCARDQTPPCELTRERVSAELCVKASSLSYHVYLGSPAGILQAYTATSGRPHLPPESQFALMQWRDSVTGPGQVLDDIGQLQSRQIPVGWVIIDNPWEAGGCNGSLQFGDSRYPADPRPMLQAIHRRGVRAMLWVSPLVTRETPHCVHPDYPDSQLLGHGTQAEIDLTNPAAAATLRRKLDSVFAYGFDGVKGDRGDELDLESRSVFEGTGGELQNDYPLLFQREVTGVLRRFRGANFATIYRSAYAGSQALVYGVSAGDLEGSFEGLQGAIRATESAAVSGFPFVGSDIGGYSNLQPPLTAELFLRWAQFAAVTPLFEVGGQGANSHFWDFGPATVRLFRDAAVLHYELFPYLYALAEGASRTGVPIVRPLAFAYPHDRAAWTRDLEFLVGRDVLAAPVTQGNGPGAPLVGPQIPARVYLPAGQWVDLWNGSVLHGPRAFVRPSPISEFPLYLRRGAAIPFNLRRPLIWPKRWPTDDLSPRGRVGWLVAPAPGPPAVARNGSGTINVRRHAAHLSISVTGPEHERQVLVVGAASPCRVTIAGHAVTKAKSAAALRRRTSGWATTTGELGGTLLKLPPGRRVQVSVEACRQG